MIFTDKIIDMLFPRHCPVCHDIVNVRGKLVCEGCEDRLSYVSEPFCLKCGKQLKNPEQELCSDCRTQKKYFNEGRAVLIYDDTMRKSIYRFKYGQRMEYADFYASQIYETLQHKIRQWKPDVIIPIPLHKSKLKKRGFNQALLIAEKLSVLTKIPVDSTILTRTKKTEKQKDLSMSMRNSNIKNAFKIRPNGVQYLSAMLIDDIYTTGATMSNAAYVLKMNGITDVFCISVCIGSELQEEYYERKKL